MPAQSPRFDWRKMRVKGYQGESGRPSSQRQSASKRDINQTGLPSAPARWACAVQAVPPRSFGGKKRREHAERNAAPRIFRMRGIAGPGKTDSERCAVFFETM